MEYLTEDKFQSYVRVLKKYDSNIELDESKLRKDFIESGLLPELDKLKEAREYYNICFVGIINEDLKKAFETFKNKHELALQDIADRLQSIFDNEWAGNSSANAINIVNTIISQIENK